MFNPHQATAPVAVYETDSNTCPIAAINCPAQQHDIRVGMPLAIAQAKVAGLYVLARKRKVEQQALSHLAVQATCWSSQVVVHTSGLLFEIAGSLRLYGGLDRLVTAVRSRITKLHPHFHIAVTPTPSSAILCARAQTEICIIDRAKLIACIGRIPVDLLELDQQQRTLLRRIGIYKIQDLLRLPRNGLAYRLGPALITILDRLTGVVPDPQAKFVYVPKFKHTLELIPARTRAEQLIPPARQLLQSLEAQLIFSCASVHQIDWLLSHDRHPATPITLRLTVEQHCAEPLLELTSLVLNTTNLAGAVEKITLIATPLPRMGERNTCLFSPTDTGEWPTLLDRLRHRLGDQQVRGMRTHAEYRPERAWSFCEPGNPSTKTVSAPRPLWLFSSPLPLPVVDGNPCFNGPLEVMCDYERIVSGWWDGYPIRRDYYRARDIHHIDLWIFRELSTGHWFVHGIF